MWSMAIHYQQYWPRWLNISYEKLKPFIKKCLHSHPSILAAPEHCTRNRTFFWFFTFSEGKSLMVAIQPTLADNLVLATRPSSSTLWRTEEGGHEYTDLYTWCMECTNAGQFFTPRYIHTLFIQLMKCENHTQCIIWKNGILLVHSNLTRCVIEVTDQTTRLYITLQFEKGHEIYLVKQRGFLISLIILEKAEWNLENFYSLLLTLIHLFPTRFSISYCCSTFFSSWPSSTHKDSTNINQVHISDLLYFDSLYLNNNDLEDETILQTLLLNSHSGDIVPSYSFVMERVCSTFEPSFSFNKTFLYKQLFEVLLKYTIFSDATLFVSHLRSYNSYSN